MNTSIIFRQLNILIEFIICLLLNFILINAVCIFFVYFSLVLKFIFFYFIPAYFILSIYSTSYPGYYKLKFFKVDSLIWVSYLANISIYIRSWIYNYSYLFFCLLCLVVLFSYTFNKIYFVIVIFFIFFFEFLYYLYNNIGQFKLLIERNFFSFNISFILIVIYLFKSYDLFSAEHNDLGIANEEDFSNLITEVSYPRWLFKSSFPSLFSEYNGEINRLNKGLKFHDLCLKDEYLKAFKNSNLNYSYGLIKKVLDNNIDFYDSFISNSNYNSLHFHIFKSLYITDKLSYLGASNKLSDRAFCDKTVFNYSNKIYNSLLFSELSKNCILFKDKTLFTKAYLNELGLSLNLVVNANLIVSTHTDNISNLLEDSKLLDGFDNFMHSYLCDNEGVSPFLNLYVNAEADSPSGMQSNNKYSDHFCRLKIASLGDTDLLSFNGFKGKNSTSLVSNFSKFFKQEFKSFARNKYDIYAESSMFSPDTFLGGELNYNKLVEASYRDFDIEQFLIYLNKYYKVFNSDVNIINWLNDLFIIVFDVQKFKYDYWSSVMSPDDILSKDPFNLYKNFMGSVLHVYEGDFSPFSYDDYKRTGVHYEDVSLPGDIKQDAWDVLSTKSFYYRYLNYSQSMEQLINSNLWLSLDDSNLDLENLEILLNYNEYLIKQSMPLKEFLELNPSISLDNVNKVTKALWYKSLNENYAWAAAVDNSDLLVVRQILNFDDYLKNTILNDSVLLNFFKGKSANVGVGLQGTGTALHEKSTAKYIFFEKYLSYNRGSGDAGGSKPNIFDIIKKFKYKHLGFKAPEAYKNHLRLLSFYDFLSENRELFNKDTDYKPFDFLDFFNNNLVGVNICDRQALLSRLLELHIDSAELRVRNLNVVLDLFDSRLQTLYQMLGEIKEQVALERRDKRWSRFNSSLVKLQDIYGFPYVYNEVLVKFAKAFIFIYDFDDAIDRIILRYFSLANCSDINDRHLYGYDLNLNYFFNYAKAHNLDWDSFESSKFKLNRAIDGCNHYGRRLPQILDDFSSSYSYVYVNDFFLDFKFFQRATNTNSRYDSFWWFTNPELYNRLSSRAFVGLYEFSTGMKRAKKPWGYNDNLIISNFEKLDDLKLSVERTFISDLIKLRSRFRGKL